MTTQKIKYSQVFDKFDDWLKNASLDQRIIEPTAMNLATVGLDMMPSNRMVLLKKYDHLGFCFFTNLNSRKAKEIFLNPKVSLCFYWGVLGRQIRIQGNAKLVENIEADQYFSTRPRDSQIGAWASHQSSEMNDRSDFEKNIEYFQNKFKDQQVIRPEFWSGFRVEPILIEFWSEGKFRLHTRELFEKFEDGWVTKLLYP